jgi:hypothetical protein
MKATIEQREKYLEQRTVDIGSQSKSDFRFVQKHAFLVHIPCQIADH